MNAEAIERLPYSDFLRVVVVFALFLGFIGLVFILSLALLLGGFSVIIEGVSEAVGVL